MMLKASSHTAAELLTILSARQLQDGQVVFAGVGIRLAPRWRSGCAVPA
jgi:glutaconate CoA-transferase subunit B